MLDHNDPPNRDHGDIRCSACQRVYERSMESCPGCWARNPQFSQVVQVTGTNCLGCLIALGAMLLGVVFFLSAGRDSAPEKDRIEQEKRDREAAARTPSPRSTPAAASAAPASPGSRSVSRTNVRVAAKGTSAVAPCAVGSDDWRISVRVTGTGRELRVSWRVTDGAGVSKTITQEMPAPNGKVDHTYLAPVGTRRIVPSVTTQSDERTGAVLVFEYTMYAEGSGDGE